jgi:hypothetical protein
MTGGKDPWDDDRVDEAIVESFPASERRFLELFRCPATMSPYAADTTLKSKPKHHKGPCFTAIQSQKEVTLVAASIKSNVGQRCE